MRLNDIFECGPSVPHPKAVPVFWALDIVHFSDDGRWRMRL